MNGLEALFGTAAVAIILLIIAAAIFAFVFWIWMIVDCARRNFKNDTEKIIWIIVIVLGQLVGALVYYLVINIFNPKGVSK